jgi:hypothetical protein
MPAGTDQFPAPSKYRSAHLTLPLDFDTVLAPVVLSTYRGRFWVDVFAKTSKVEVMGEMAP